MFKYTKNNELFQIWKWFEINITVVELLSKAFAIIVKQIIL